MMILEKKIDEVRGSLFDYMKWFEACQQMSIECRPTKNVMELRKGRRTGEQIDNKTC